MSQIVADLMENLPEVVLNSESIGQVAKKFAQNSAEELPVVNELGQMVGVVTGRGIIDAVVETGDMDSPIDLAVEDPWQAVQQTVNVSQITWDAKHDLIWVVDNTNTLVGVLHRKKMSPLEATPWETRAVLTSVLEASFDGILLADADGNVVFVNSAYERTTGLQREQIIGKSLQQLLDDKLFNQSSVLFSLEQKAPISSVHKYVTGKQALTTANPIFDEDGNVIWLVCNIRDISELTKLRDELAATKELTDKYSHELEQLRQVKHDGFISKSKAMEPVFELAAKTADFDSTVLIQGESGVGKEVLAKFIHQQSSRANGPFIKVNCAAIPMELVESELFGYAHGSFTGADQRGKPGMFELANNGTILLDEIGELPLSVQPKLLRAIQDKEIFKVGGREASKFNARVLAATNKNLAEEVHQGKFREDLFFRLNVVPITVPPLRKRQEDIPELVHYFIEKHNKRYSKHKTISAEVMNILINYAWPGNVRELENLIEYLFIVSPGNEIGIEQLPLQLLVDHEFTNKTSPGQLQFLLERFEKRIIINTLGNYPSIRKAAAALDINPSTLVRKIRKHQINSNN